MSKRICVFKDLGIGVLLIAAAFANGCGGSDRPKTIPVTGRVTINGQSPGERGKVRFTPTSAAEGYSKRPASGAYTTEGTLRVMSWEVDDGLVPGHYTVNISPGDPSSTKVPAKYFQSGTSGLEVDVPVDKDEIGYNIDIVTQ